MTRTSAATDISKVLITGGRETGGLQAFAVTLAGGFVELGIPAEVIEPGQICKRWRDLRDASVLKILSTTAVFAAPFSRRAICVAHCLPRADAQGWTKILALFASFKLALLSPGSRLVAVSFYTASHLKAIWDIGVNAVIHNPLSPLFLPCGEESQARSYITYVGRLHPIKNIHKLLPAMANCLDENPELRICIVGDGVLRAPMEEQFGHDSRIEFAGNMDTLMVRTILRKTKVFISGCETEALGISYLEALSQGCSVVMPACGGGLEIAPELIGTRILLMPLSFDSNSIRSTLRQALQATNEFAPLPAYQAAAVARQYLQAAPTSDKQA